MSNATVLESEAIFLRHTLLGTLGKLAYALTTLGTSPTEAQVNAFLNAMRPGVPPSVGRLRL